MKPAIFLSGLLLITACMGHNKSADDITITIHKAYTAPELYSYFVQANDVIAFNGDTAKLHASQKVSVKHDSTLTLAQQVATSPAASVTNNNPLFLLYIIVYINLVKFVLNILL